MTQFFLVLLGNAIFGAGEMARWVNVVAVQARQVKTEDGRRERTTGNRSPPSCVFCGVDTPERVHGHVCTHIHIRAHNKGLKRRSGENSSVKLDLQQLT